MENLPVQLGNNNAWDHEQDGEIHFVNIFGEAFKDFPMVNQYVGVNYEV